MILHKCDSKFRLDLWVRKALGWLSKGAGLEESEQNTQCQTLCMLRGWNDVVSNYWLPQMEERNAQEKIWSV